LEEERLGNGARRFDAPQEGAISRRMTIVDGKNVSFGNLDLPPRYSAERGEAGAYLVDPGGRRVMQLPGDLALANTREPGRPDPEPDRWQELSRSLLIRLSQKNAECERLRDRLTELGEQLEAAEAERDQANAIAEDLYEFFRNRVREVIGSKEDSGREGRRLSDGDTATAE
jgi:hypothetical protein